MSLENVYEELYEDEIDLAMPETPEEFHRLCVRLGRTRKALEALREEVEKVIKLAGKNPDLFWKDEDGYLRNTYVEILRAALDRAERAMEGGE